MSDFDALPVPDALLGPLLEVAADELRAMDSADVPISLRPIHGFDRRGLLAGPGRRQLLRALEQEGAFRSKVLDAFSARAEVKATLESWSVDRAVEIVARAHARRDLALLASALWAAQPPGAMFGLGLAVERFEREQSERGTAAEVRVAERERAEVEEGRRRAETARLRAESEVERLQAELDKERGARRTREERIAEEADAAHRELAQLRKQLDEATTSADDERLRRTREAKRAHALEDDVQRLRRELDTAARAAQPGLEPSDARVVAEALAAAEQAAAALRALGREEESQREAAPRSRPRRMQREKAEREVEAREKAPAERTRPMLPPGMHVDAPEAVDAMLRTNDVVLIVDGYNVSKRSWPDATPADQRERLAVAAAQIHTRTGCEVTLVFDGDGLSAPAPFRRRGVRVLFSDADEEADDVVVREVDELPKRIPVIVASSDAWVREHSQRAGAEIVSADALLAAFRRFR